MRLTYVLPIRRERAAPDPELAGYITWLAGRVDLVIVDGSPDEVFAEHERGWRGLGRHIPPAPELRTPNGKVGNVLTGLRAGRHERVVIADDDVRYDEAGLRRMELLLDEADVVRPQNYFQPLPWHARWDTGRTLLNRVAGGDWPGTLGVRRSTLERTGGYRGDVLFENLELVRMVRAAGGREIVAQDLYVRRLPPTARHFLSQRIRQAYDEFARPGRLAVFLTIGPVVGTLALARQWRLVAAVWAGTVGLAEVGRRRGGGGSVFPADTPPWAPLWVCERAICAWLAVGSRLLYGGVRYRGGVLRDAATPERELRRRLGAGAARRVGADGEARRAA